YREPVPVQRRASPVVGIAGSAAGDIGVAWRDGFAEIRSNSELVGEVSIPAVETWSRLGVKAAWTSDSRRFIWCTGTNAFLTVWEPGTDHLEQWKFPETILCLAINEQKQLLALGIDEQSRGDGEVVVVETARLREAMPDAHETSAQPAAHLLSADWEPLFDLLAEEEMEARISNLRLKVPQLEEAFAQQDKWLEETD